MVEIALAGRPLAEAPQDLKPFAEQCALFAPRPWLPTGGAAKPLLNCQRANVLAATLSWKAAAKVGLVSS